jgi:hypothetical protein
MGRKPGPDPEWRAFLRFRRIERHLPMDVRARVLERGRAFIASGGESPPAPAPEAQAPIQPPPALQWLRPVVRISFAALIALAAGAVGAVLALHGGPERAPAALEPPRRPSVAPAARQVEPPVPSIAPAAAEAEPVVRVEPTRPRRAAHIAALSTAGLELLQRAHAAYTRNEFSSALALIAEHARRFPRGSLAEEREALRVRSLLGLGHREEAQRAAAAFAARFHHSVLLPRIHDGEKASE